MDEKHCRLCGAEIPAEANPRKLYCSSRCARRAATIRQRQHDLERKLAEIAAAKARKFTPLDYCMREADRLGISYGQYMARRMSDGI